MPADTKIRKTQCG